MSKYKDEEKRKEYLRNYWSKRYWEAFEEVRAYKLAYGCTDCGYADHHAVLEFDHILERGPKKACVASLYGKGMKAVWEEIAKCDVVCANCHNLRTWNRTRVSQYGREPDGEGK